ncbi:DUF1877 family protein [Capnocytophaga endodontalis]|uniref:DUF1877 domain-containing protein n=1 Tax=Capnocytophaga endodontalis TaxID=2708117 RepID=A0A1Z4BPP2_9FLAO|nr:DUF1877 family protein [Capnocytophaga endodontalis]ASF43229.1 hypothetical protein CBG49_09165 [Capnocytophaga endodontalis]
MARLGVFYALSDEQVDTIAEQDDDKMYAYMLNTIEENLLGTSKSYQIDKAWEGIHYCLCEGDWYKEEGIAPNIVFGGYLLLDHNDCVIFVNDLDNIQKIVDYLEENDLQEIIKKNFDKIPSDYSYTKNEEELNYLLSWSKGVLDFYKYALKNQLNTIFTVDL